MTTIDQARTPQSLEELRTLALALARGEGDLSLGGKAQSVFSRLLDAPEQAAVRSISELAASLGVNPSTLTRLAKRLGFDGFSDFQSVFRNAIAKANETVRNLQWFRVVETRGHIVDGKVGHFQVTLNIGFTLE